MVFEIGVDDVPDKPRERRHYDTRVQGPHSVAAALTGLGPMAPGAPDPYKQRWREGWNHKRHAADINQDRERLQETMARQRRDEAFTAARRERLEHWSNYNNLNIVTGRPVVDNGPAEPHPTVRPAEVRAKASHNPIVGPSASELAARRGQNNNREEVLRRDGLTAPRHRDRETVASALKSGHWGGFTLPKGTVVPPPPLNPG